QLALNRLLVARQPALLGLAEIPTPASAFAGRSRLRRRLDQGICHRAGRVGEYPADRKDPICFSPYLYCDRNLVERFFNKIKQCRRVATQYDKLASNYLAFVKLACIRLWLRVYECTA